MTTKRRSSPQEAHHLSPLWKSPAGLPKGQGAVFPRSCAKQSGMSARVTPYKGHLRPTLLLLESPGPSIASTDLTLEAELSAWAILLNAVNNQVLQGKF